MPSGRVHDGLTLLLAAPIAVGSFAYTRAGAPAAIITIAFLFGGLMFGPDLDVVSRQYSRWGVLRGFWYPYRSVFKHRSRFSHGLIFGALIRVVYFIGVLSLLAFGALYLYAMASRAGSVSITTVIDSWQPFGNFVRSALGSDVMVLTFVGLWLGATSHTLTDIAATFIKTGRAEKLF